LPLFVRPSQPGSSPDQRGPSHWEFSAATGVTAPGGYLGSSRGLRTTAYSIVSVYRELPWAGLQARTSWTAAAQESSIASQYRGYDGNYRSKTRGAEVQSETALLCTSAPLHL
jgi:hypothetical protein